MTQLDRTEVEAFEALEFMPALSDSAQHVTVYKDGRPVATLLRRRVLDRTSPVWQVFATDGSLLRAVRYVPTSYTALARITRQALRNR